MWFMKLKYPFAICFLIFFLFTSVELIAQEEVTVTSHSDVDSSDLALIDNDGKLIKLSEMKGKVIVLNFWATWCQPCIAELPSLQKLYSSLASEEDIVFAAVEMDQDPEKAAKFFKKRKYSIPLYSLGSALPSQMQTNSIPMTVIIAKNGEIVVKKIGMIDFGSAKLRNNLLQLTKERADISYL